MGGFHARRIPCDGGLAHSVPYPRMVDWRSRVRKLVNREGYLSFWRLALMRVIDPIEWYMRKSDEDNIRPPRRPGDGAVGWTGYAPIGRPPDLEQHRRILEESTRRQDALRELREGLRREYASFIELKAHELLDRGQVAIHAATGRVQARLVRFRNGAVFEYTSVSSQGTGAGRTRMELREFAEPVQTLVVYLENAVLALPLDPRPLK
jgi:hypothetical protein